LKIFNLFSLYRVISSIFIIICGCLLQWILIGGVTPLTLVQHRDVQDILEEGRAANIADILLLRHEPKVRRIIQQQATFQMGMVFPRWGSKAYGTEDDWWTDGLIDLYRQTGSQWVEMTINFYQPSLTSTQIQAKPSLTPTPQTMAAGIRVARTLGYRVLVAPLLTVGGPEGWAGDINFVTIEQEQQWFDHYWKAIMPYVRAADQAGAEEFAIGTEYEWLQLQAPASLWNELIARFHQNFKGWLVYDMNWSSLYKGVSPWMGNPSLAALGVSVYIPLSDTSRRLDPASIAALWKSDVEQPLDGLSEAIKKPVLITEIGYRNSADALYAPWQQETKAPADPDEQAAAYDAALMNIHNDPHITGIFFWAWSLPVFQPNGLPASDVLHKWYTSSLFS
jgi:hypothetical protein